MDRERYILTQQQLLTFGRLILDLPLDEFCRALETSLAVGHVLDPTLYRDAQEPAEEILSIANGARFFQESVRAAKAMQKLRMMATS